MLFSVIAGRGSMAQFSHPQCGGSGQWMAGGATMISDMFNNALKARVDALCNELSALIRSEPGFAANSFQSQSQGANGTLQRRSSNPLVTEGPDQSNWWPADLGVPSSLGAQNELRYAYFPATRCLAIDINGKVTVYDTQDHQISGLATACSLETFASAPRGNLVLPSRGGRSFEGMAAQGWEWSERRRLIRLLSAGWLPPSVSSSRGFPRSRGRASGGSPAT